MAFLDIARSRASYEYATVFRGTFDSGAAVVWGNRYVKTTSGLIEGRIVSTDAITRGTSDTVGGTPPKASFSMRLVNHNSTLSYAFRGNATSNTSVDYFSDGFRNLSGKLYMLVKDPADGSTYESALTPTMVCHGVDTDGLVINLQFASKDDSILGESILGPITGQMIQDSAQPGGTPDGTAVYRDGTTAVLSQSDGEKELRTFTKNLDKPIPFAYGPTELPLNEVGDSAPFQRFTLFLSTVEPRIEDFDEWEAYALYGKPITTAETGNAGLDAALAKVQTLYKIQRTVTLGDGTAFTLWVVWYRFQRIGFGPAEQIEVPRFFIPSINYLGISFPPPALSTENKGPVAIIRAMAGDHAALGPSALDDTSFLRVGGELQALQGACGGLYDASRPLSKPFGDICRAFGLQAWVDTDDKIHAFSGWGQDDKDTIDAGTAYHITQAEILDGWRETLPDRPPERGSVADRVTVNWPQHRADFYPADYLPEHLFGATRLPSAEVFADEIDGTWIFPPRSRDVMSARTNRLSFIARRIEFVGRSWLATEPIGTMYLVSHVFGQADNSGTGYVRRPMRLESTEFTPGEDGCRVVLVDLQGDYETKPSTLDTITNWIATGPTAGDTMKLTNASTTIEAGAGNVRKFTINDVNRHIWTPGAASSSNRRSYKITAFTDARHVTVEFAYAGSTETITATGATGWDAPWVIMDTQESKGSSYRPDKIRLCEETTGLFRDGTTAGYQVV